VAKRKSQSRHEEMVKRVANVLIEKEYRDVRVDLPEFEKPKEITWKKTGLGHFPDITGQKGNFKVFEVETDDSISDQHTEDQWTLFSRWSQENDAVFWVVVPQHCVAAARKRLNELNIQAKVWGL
jgi:hypothetical protein